MFRKFQNEASWTEHEGEHWPSGHWSLEDSRVIRERKDVSAGTRDHQRQRGRCRSHAWAFSLPSRAWCSCLGTTLIKVCLYLCHYVLKLLPKSSKWQLSSSSSSQLESPQETCPEALSFIGLQTLWLFLCPLISEPPLLYSRCSLVILGSLPVAHSSFSLSAEAYIFHWLWPLLLLNTLASSSLCLLLYHQLFSGTSATASYKVSCILMFCATMFSLRSYLCIM